jgi:hypothetical protein
LDCLIDSHFRGNDSNELLMSDYENIFPGKLTDKEKELLFSVLPENKPGYKIYKERIEELFVIGQGRFGNGNFILGMKDDKPDFSLPSAPVFAIGTIVFDKGVIDITIHEEAENKIEFDIALKENLKIPDKITVIKKWNFSDWIPGQSAPGDNSYVREVIIYPDMYILAIAPSQKKIWLYEKESGVNHILPLSNFFNELIRVLKIKNEEIIKRPAFFFENLNSYKDEQLALAFLGYNKYMHKLKIDYSFFEKPVKIKKQKKLFNLFIRG